MRIFNIGIIAVEFVGAIAYFAKRRLTFRRPSAHVNYLLPGAYLSSFFVIPLIYKLLQLAITPESDSVIGKYVEWTELCLAFGLCLFTCFVLRQLHIEMRNRQTYMTKQSIKSFSNATPNKGD